MHSAEHMVVKLEKIVKYFKKFAMDDNVRVTYTLPDSAKQRTLWAGVVSQHSSSVLKSIELADLIDQHGDRAIIKCSSLPQGTTVFFKEYIKSKEDKGWKTYLALTAEG